MDSQRHESVTHWLHRIAADDDSAAQQQLWNRYFARLAALARTRLTGAAARRRRGRRRPQRIQQLLCAARAGRFPELHDRTGLWPLLVKITARKAINQVKRQQAKKRSSAAEEVVADLAQLVGDEPSPQFAAEVAEQVERLLGLLDDDLRKVAVMKLEGFTNEEIAVRFGVVERSIARKLARIRAEWDEGVETSAEKP